MLDRKTRASCYLFTQVQGKAVFLVCCLYNLNHYYETEHMEKYKNLTDAEQEWISECLLAKFKKKQGLFLFTELCTSKDGAVKTSFATSHKITKNGKLFSDGEFIKECLVASVVLI